MILLSSLVVYQRVFSDAYAQIAKITKQTGAQLVVDAEKI